MHPSGMRKFPPSSSMAHQWGELGDTGGCVGFTGGDTGGGHGGDTGGGVAEGTEVQAHDESPAPLLQEKKTTRNGRWVVQTLSTLHVNTETQP